MVSTVEAREKYVRCPKCGHRFPVRLERPKGAGAHYAGGIKRLTPLHREILEILAEQGPMTKRRLGGLLAERGRRVTGNSLSGRLSELLGLGYVAVEKAEVREVDPESRQFRFVKKPVWRITPAGLEALGKA